jgi:hypothetical protein
VLLCSVGVRNVFTLTLNNMRTDLLQGNEQFAVRADYVGCQSPTTTTVLLGSSANIVRDISFFCSTSCQNSNVCVPFF